MITHYTQHKVISIQAEPQKTQLDSYKEYKAWLVNSQEKGYTRLPKSCVDALHSFLVNMSSDQIDIIGNNAANERSIINSLQTLKDKAIKSDKESFFKDFLKTHQNPTEYAVFEIAMQQVLQQYFETEAEDIRDQLRMNNFDSVTTRIASLQEEMASFFHVEADYSTEKHGLQELQLKYNEQATLLIAAQEKLAKKADKLNTLIQTRKEAPVVTELLSEAQTEIDRKEATLRANFEINCDDYETQQCALKEEAVEIQLEVQQLAAEMVSQVTAQTASDLLTQEIAAFNDDMFKYNAEIERLGQDISKKVIADFPIKQGKAKSSVRVSQLKKRYNQALQDSGTRMSLTFDRIQVMKSRFKRIKSSVMAEIEKTQVGSESTDALQQKLVTVKSRIDKFESKKMRLTVLEKHLSTQAIACNAELDQLYTQLNTDIAVKIEEDKQRRESDLVLLQMKEDYQTSVIAVEEERAALLKTQQKLEGQFANVENVAEKMGQLRELQQLHNRYLKDYTEIRQQVEIFNMNLKKETKTDSFTQRDSMKRQQMTAVRQDVSTSGPSHYRQTILLENQSLHAPLDPLPVLQNISSVEVQCELLVVEPQLLQLVPLPTVVDENIVFGEFKKAEISLRPASEIIFTPLEMPEDIEFDFDMPKHKAMPFRIDQLGLPMRFVLIPLSKKVTPGEIEGIKEISSRPTSGYVSASAASSLSGKISNPKASSGYFSEQNSKGKSTAHRIFTYNAPKVVSAFWKQIQDFNKVLTQAQVK